MNQQHHDSHIMVSNPPPLIVPGEKHPPVWVGELQNDRVIRSNNGLMASNEE
jgi:hypothetical protein